MHLSEFNSLEIQSLCAENYYRFLNRKVLLKRLLSVGLLKYLSTLFFNKNA